MLHDSKLGHGPTLSLYLRYLIDIKNYSQKINTCRRHTHENLKFYSLASTAVLTLCILGNFACFFCHLWIFLKNELIQKNLFGIPSECQIVWIQIRPDVLSGLIWVQTACKGYQQTTKVATSEERFNAGSTSTACINRL